MRIFFVGIPATNSSCPGLSRASTFFVPRERSWMAGTSPAMTMWKRLYESAPRLYAIALPCGGGLGERGRPRIPNEESCALSIDQPAVERGQKTVVEDICSRRPLVEL